MSKHLRRDLEHLQRDLLDMAASVEGAICDAIQALQNRSVHAAQKVISRERQIDLQDNKVEEDCLKTLALHQPVAVDLRRVAAALKINTDLERMGDLAEDIAERALILARPPHVPIPGDLQRMADLTLLMVRQSLDAFVQLDVDQARRVSQLDDEVDRYNYAIIEGLVEVMRKMPELVPPGLSLFSAIRHLERIADHATNIAEDVIYLVEGEIVRHRPAALPREAMGQ
ncbi:MAG: phosphate signaling complex protein PhoU [Gemmataceae bacterium]